MTAMARPDHAGETYLEVMRTLHARLQPRCYLEIGTLSGLTLALSSTQSIAIDPKFQISDAAILTSKPICHLFQMTSDDFFAAHRPDAIFGRPIGLAFLDGMHRCEYLLRDFMNTEKHCDGSSVVVMHDCIPVELPMTTRDQCAEPAIAPHRQGWWTGDVWRTVQALKHFRPDLAIEAYDAPPTGLVLVRHLDPASRVLDTRYDEAVAAMMSWDLDLDGYMRSLDIRPTADILT